MAKINNITKIKVEAEDEEEKDVNSSSFLLGEKKKLKRKNKEEKSEQKRMNRAEAGNRQAGNIAKQRLIAKERLNKNNANKSKKTANEQGKENKKKEFALKRKIDILQEIEARHKDSLEKEVDLGNRLADKQKMAVGDVFQSKQSAVSSTESGKPVDEVAIDSKTLIQRPVKLYKRIAFSFVFLTLILLTAVGYYSFVRATIILIPNQERISNTLIVDIQAKNNASLVGINSVLGRVELLKMEHQQIYQASGTQVIGEEVSGRVKIINNYSKNQPLVAGTRLLPPDGMRLYRLKNTVNVPAGGEIMVDVYADTPSPSSEIGPTRFTIPGLWAGLQDKIYAENEEPIVYQQKVKRIIEESDIQKAKQDLKQTLLLNSQRQANELFKDFSHLIYQLEENSITYSFTGQAGEAKDEFNGTIRGNVIVVGFNKEEINELAKQKLIASLPKGRELVMFDEDNIIYSLNSYNYASGAASLKVSFEGRVGLSADASIIEVNKITGLNQRELDAYLSGLPEIANYEVKYYPPFIKKMPSLADRIKVEIRK